jgi:serine/threonine protein kinase
VLCRCCCCCCCQADSPSRKELELFLKEVQTLAKLHHRNIVQFYGACLETGSMFFVTELMKVRTLLL